MAQHDGVIDNGTGNAVRTDINNALAAINSNNAGASDPSTTYAYQWYVDTGDNTLKIRNAANNAFINVSTVGGIGTENLGLGTLGSGINNVSEDTTPQLGGNLDVQAFEIITATTNGNIKLTADGTGFVEVKGNTNAGTIQLNCESNSHGVKLQSPAHSAAQSYTLILPDNQVAADKFLKVKSISGSGATAIGQLEYTDTFTGSVTFEDAIIENVFTITDGSSVDLDPDNGMIQQWTLGANRTATESLTAGQSMLLMVADGSSYALTFPTITWVGGSAPTLATSGFTVIELWKAGSTLYGATVGDVA